MTRTTVVAIARTRGDMPRPVGLGTWLYAGRPRDAHRTTERRIDAGVVEYVPGDLVITVRAGTTLSDIARVTHAHGQRLSLDPFTSGDATIGAVAATASHGPLSLGYGRVRDLTLGVAATLVDDCEIRAGGRVVKNVAGFDLVRLLVGSWGTLGAITELSLRLHAVPPVESTLTFAVPRADIDALVRGLNAPAQVGNATACAALLLIGTGAPSARRATGPTHMGPSAATPLTWQLAARLGGNSQRVEALTARLSAQLAALSETADLAWIPTAVPTESFWRDLTTTPPYENGVVRWRDLPTTLEQTLARALTWCTAAQMTTRMLIAEPLSGRVTAFGALPDAVPHDTTFDDPSMVCDCLPPAWWVHVPPPRTAALDARIRGVLHARPSGGTA